MGVSMAMPAAQNAILNAVAGSEIAKAPGTFNMLRYLGGVFGVAVLAAVFAHNGNSRSTEAFSKGFAAAAVDAAASFSIIAAIAGLGLPHAARRQFIGAVTRWKAHVAPATSSYRAKQARPAFPTLGAQTD